MSEWTPEDCEHCGHSLKIFVITHTQPTAAVEAWRHQYSPQLDTLFKIEGFQKFMETVAEHILLHSKVGVGMRFAAGAALSTFDAATDVYVIWNYAMSDELAGVAVGLSAMLLVNLFAQILNVVVQFQKKVRCNFGAREKRSDEQ